MDTSLLTAPESYTGPQIENPVLREWTHVLGLPFGSLISVDGVIYESCTEKGSSEARFVLYTNGGAQDIPADELISPFIESKISLLRVGL